VQSCGLLSYAIAVSQRAIRDLYKLAIGDTACKLFHEDTRECISAKHVHATFRVNIVDILVGNHYVKIAQTTEGTVDWIRINVCAGTPARRVP
jgi:hypothetical protein